MAARQPAGNGFPGTYISVSALPTAGEAVEDAADVEDVAEEATIAPPLTRRTTGREGKAEGEEETELKISPS